MEIRTVVQWRRGHINNTGNTNKATRYLPDPIAARAARRLTSKLCPRTPGRRRDVKNVCDASQFSHRKDILDENPRRSFSSSSTEILPSLQVPQTAKFVSAEASCNTSIRQYVGWSALEKLVKSLGNDVGNAPGPEPYIGRAVT